MTEAKINPEILRWARERMGLTLKRTKIKCDSPEFQQRIERIIEEIN